MADGSDLETAIGKIKIPPTDHKDVPERLTIWAPCLWLAITIISFALSVWCFKHGVSGPKPYWPLLWFTAILGSLLLSSLIASWDQAKYGGNHKRPGWFNSTLTQGPINEIAIGLVVTYGLFIIFEAFDVAEAINETPAKSLMVDKSNIIRLLLSPARNSGDSYLNYFVILGLIFLCVVVLPALRWLKRNEARRHQNLKDHNQKEVPPELILTDEQRHILEFDNISIPATPRDCRQIDAKIHELEALLRDLRKQEQTALKRIKEIDESLEQKTPRRDALAQEIPVFEDTAKDFGLLRMIAAKRSGVLLDKRFVTDGAEPLRHASVDYLSETSEHCQAYHASWLAMAEKAKLEKAALDKAISDLELERQGCVKKLAELRVMIDKVEALLVLAREFLEHCLIPAPPFSTPVPIWGIFRIFVFERGRNREPKDLVLAALTWIFLVLLALNIFFIAPPIEMEKKQVATIASVGWFWAGFLITCLSTIPLTQTLEGVKWSFGANNDPSIWQRAPIRGGLLALVGLGVALGSISLLLPPKPVRKVTELALNCKADHEGQPANWSFENEFTDGLKAGNGVDKKTYALLPNDIKFDMIEHDLSTCEPDEALSKGTSFVAVIGLASQEGPDDLERKRANARAKAMVGYLRNKPSPTSPVRWSGPIVSISVDKAPEVSTKDVSRYGEPKLLHRSQRMLVLLREGLVDEPAKDDKQPVNGEFDNLPERYKLAGEYILDLVAKPVKSKIDESRVNLKAEDKIEAMASAQFNPPTIAMKDKISKYLYSTKLSGVYRENWVLECSNPVIEEGMTQPMLMECTYKPAP